MLHLTSLLSAARPPTLTPAPGASSAPPPRLQFDPSSWAPDRGGGGGMTARSAALWGGGEGAHGGAMAGSWGWGWRRRGSSSGDVSGSGGEHPLLSYPPSMAVLSAFRQVLRNTQGIVIDSGGAMRGAACVDPCCSAVSGADLPCACPPHLAQRPPRPRRSSGAWAWCRVRCWLLAGWLAAHPCCGCRLPLLTQ